MLIRIEIDPENDEPLVVASMLRGMAKLFRPVEPEIVQRTCTRRNDCPVSVKCEGVNKIFIDDCEHFEDTEPVT